MRKASALWTNVLLMSWQDRVVALAVAVIAAALLIISTLWGAHIGAHVGAHVGAQGWVCGQMPKGAPYCQREPELPTQGDARAP